MNLWNVYIAIFKQTKDTKVPLFVFHAVYETKTLEKMVKIHIDYGMELANIACETMFIITQKVSAHFVIESQERGY